MTSYINVKNKEGLTKLAEIQSSVDITKELSISEINRLKRQDKERLAGAAQYLSAKEVWHDFGS
jgi:hypothetical protein